VLERWYLLTNVPEEVDATTLALWYYWRWRIETFFKLLGKCQYIPNSFVPVHPEQQGLQHPEQ
jgi:hypothetical protein